MRLLTSLTQCIGLASAIAITSMPPQQTTVPAGPVTAAIITNEELEAEFANIRIVQRQPRDSWQCATEAMTQYFKVPLPSGSLFDALASYGNSQTSKYCSLPIYDWYLCDPIPTSAWCGFTTAAPSSVLPAYSTHISVASSWSSKHSSGLASLPTNCPVTWKDAGIEVPNGHAWLNETLALVKCYRKE